MDRIAKHRESERWRSYPQVVEIKEIPVSNRFEDCAAHR
jgi:hypothetical protein